LNRSNTIICLIRLTDIITDLIKNNISTNIWDIAEKNKNISLDICNRSNGYKELYHIHSLFKWFKNDPIFTISYKLNKTCSLCFIHNEENIVLDPLLSVNLNDIKVCKSTKEYLYNLLNIKFSICDKCSYDIYKNIKNDNHFKTCVIHTIHGVLMPYILLFTFAFTKLQQIKMI
jgi:hypothetical protein